MDSGMEIGHAGPSSLPTLPSTQEEPMSKGQLSPLTGSYLLIVMSEAHSEEDREKIIQRLTKGLLAWDTMTSHVDLNCELLNLSNSAPDGDDVRNGEKLVQWASENLVVEVLIHSQVNTLLQCMKNLLSSFTRHRHIIHAGYSYQGTGSWLLQDGTFSITDFIELWDEHEVRRLLSAYKGDINLALHCAADNGWSDERFRKEPFSKLCQVDVNGGDKLTQIHNAGVLSFVEYISKFLIPAPLKEILEPSEIVGNIRFSHPTLYVFPGGQGDAALFGVNGFNMLIDGGFSRKACFWDFTRHLDRLDAVLLTRVNQNSMGGISALLERKNGSNVYPQIGHFFGNIVERKGGDSNEKKCEDDLVISLTEQGSHMYEYIRGINMKPQFCFRENIIEPINLYHKVGHGKLDLFVLNPAKDSRELKEFLSKWKNDCGKAFSTAKMNIKVDGQQFSYPVLNLVSICALVVWQPANPRDRITRILFPGSTPQQKIFDSLSKLRHLEYLRFPVCTAKSIAASHKSNIKSEKVISEVRHHLKSRSGSGFSSVPPDSRVSKTSSVASIPKDTKAVQNRAEKQQLLAGSGRGDISSTTGSNVTSAAESRVIKGDETIKKEKVELRKTEITKQAGTKLTSTTQDNKVKERESRLSKFSTATTTPGRKTETITTVTKTSSVTRVPATKSTPVSATKKIESIKQQSQESPKKEEIVKSPTSPKKDDDPKKQSPNGVKKPSPTTPKKEGDEKKESSGIPKKEEKKDEESVKKQSPTSPKKTGAEGSDGGKVAGKPAAKPVSSQKYGISKSISKTTTSVASTTTSSPKQTKEATNRKVVEHKTAPIQRQGSGPKLPVEKLEKEKPKASEVKPKVSAEVKPKATSEVKSKPADFKPKAARPGTAKPSTSGIPKTNGSKPVAITGRSSSKKEIVVVAGAAAVAAAAVTAISVSSIEESKPSAQSEPEEKIRAETNGTGISSPAEEIEKESLHAEPAPEEPIGSEIEKENGIIGTTESSSELSSLDPASVNDEHEERPPTQASSADPAEDQAYEVQTPSSTYDETPKAGRLEGVSYPEYEEEDEYLVVEKSMDDDGPIEYEGERTYENGTAPPSLDYEVQEPSDSTEPIVSAQSLTLNDTKIEGVVVDQETPEAAIESDAVEITGKAEELSPLHSGMAKDAEDAIPEKPVPIMSRLTPLDRDEEELEDSLELPAHRNIQETQSDSVTSLDYEDEPKANEVKEGRESNDELESESIAATGSHEPKVSAVETSGSQGTSQDVNLYSHVGSELQEKQMEGESPRIESESLGPQSSPTAQNIEKETSVESQSEPKREQGAETESISPRNEGAERDTHPKEEIGSDDKGEDVENQESEVEKAQDTDFPDTKLVVEKGASDKSELHKETNGTSEFLTDSSPKLTSYELESRDYIIEEKRLPLSGSSTASQMTLPEAEIVRSGSGTSQIGGGSFVSSTEEYEVDSDGYGSGSFSVDKGQSLAVHEETQESVSGPQAEPTFPVETHEPRQISPELGFQEEIRTESFEQTEIIGVSEKVCGKEKVEEKQEQEVVKGEAQSLATPAGDSDFEEDERKAVEEFEIISKTSQVQEAEPDKPIKDESETKESKECVEEPCTRQTCSLTYKMEQFVEKTSGGLSQTEKLIEQLIRGNETEDDEREVPPPSPSRAETKPESPVPEKKAEDSKVDKIEEDNQTQSLKPEQTLTEKEIQSPKDEKVASEPECLEASPHKAVESVPKLDSSSPPPPVPSAIPANIPRHLTNVIRTPDEVAELPVHEEVEPGTYEADDFLHSSDHEAEDYSEVDHGIENTPISSVRVPAGAVKVEIEKSPSAQEPTKEGKTPVESHAVPDKGNQYETQEVLGEHEKHSTELGSVEGENEIESREIIADSPGPMTADAALSPVLESLLTSAPPENQTSTISHPKVESGIHERKSLDAGTMDRKEPTDAETGHERKASVHSSSETGISERKESDAGITERKSSDVRITERKSSDIGITERKSFDVGITERKSSDVGITERKSSDVGITERKSSDVGITERKTSDAGIRDNNAADAGIVDVTEPKQGEPGVDEKMVAEKSDIERRSSIQAESVQERKASVPSVAEKKPSVDSQHSDPEGNAPDVDILERKSSDAGMNEQITSETDATGKKAPVSTESSVGERKLSLDAGSSVLERKISSDSESIAHGRKPSVDTETGIHEEKSSEPSITDRKTSVDQEAVVGSGSEDGSNGRPETGSGELGTDPVVAPQRDAEVIRESTTHSHLESQDQDLCAAEAPDSDKSLETTKPISFSSETLDKAEVRVPSQASHELMLKHLDKDDDPDDHLNVIQEEENEASSPLSVKTVTSVVITPSTPPVGASEGTFFVTPAEECRESGAEQEKSAKNVEVVSKSSPETAVSPAQDESKDITDQTLPSHDHKSLELHEPVTIGESLGSTQSKSDNGANEEERKVSSDGDESSVSSSGITVVSQTTSATAEEEILALSKHFDGITKSEQEPVPGPSAGGIPDTLRAQAEAALAEQGQDKATIYFGEGEGVHPGDTLRSDVEDDEIYEIQSEVFTTGSAIRAGLLTAVTAASATIMRRSPEEYLEHHAGSGHSSLESYTAPEPDAEEELKIEKDRKLSLDTEFPGSQESTERIGKPLFKIGSSSRSSIASETDELISERVRSQRSSITSEIDEPIFEKVAIETDETESAQVPIFEKVHLKRDSLASNVDEQVPIFEKVHLKRDSLTSNIDEQGIPIFEKVHLKRDSLASNIDEPVGNLPALQDQEVDEPRIQKAEAGVTSSSAEKAEVHVEQIHLNDDIKKTEQDQAPVSKSDLTHANRPDIDEPSGRVESREHRESISAEVEEPAFQQTFVHKEASSVWEEKESVKDAGEHVPEMERKIEHDGPDDLHLHATQFKESSLKSEQVLDMHANQVESEVDAGIESEMPGAQVEGDYEPSRDEDKKKGYESKDDVNLRDSSSDGNTMEEAKVSSALFSAIGSSFETLTQTIIQGTEEIKSSSCQESFDTLAQTKGTPAEQIETREDRHEPHPESPTTSTLISSITQIQKVVTGPAETVSTTHSVSETSISGSAKSEQEPPSPKSVGLALSSVVSGASEAVSGVIAAGSDGEAQIYGTATNSPPDVQTLSPGPSGTEKAHLSNQKADQIGGTHGILPETQKQVENNDGISNRTTSDSTSTQVGITKESSGAFGSEIVSDAEEDVHLLERSVIGELSSSLHYSNSESVDGKGASLGLSGTSEPVPAAKLDLGSVQMESDTREGTGAIIQLQGDKPENFVNQSISNIDSTRAGTQLAALEPTGPTSQSSGQAGIKMLESQDAGFGSAGSHHPSSSEQAGSGSKRSSAPEWLKETDGNSIVLGTEERVRTISSSSVESSQSQDSSSHSQRHEGLIKTSPNFPGALLEQTDLFTDGKTIPSDSLTSTTVVKTITSSGRRFSSQDSPDPASVSAHVLELQRRGSEMIGMSHPPTTSSFIMKTTFEDSKGAGEQSPSPDFQLGGMSRNLATSSHGTELPMDRSEQNITFSTSPGTMTTTRTTIQEIGDPSSSYSSRHAYDTFVIGTEGGGAGPEFRTGEQAFTQSGFFDSSLVGGHGAFGVTSQELEEHPGAGTYFSLAQHQQELMDDEQTYSSGEFSDSQLSTVPPPPLDLEEGYGFGPMSRDFGFPANLNLERDAENGNMNTNRSSSSTTTISRTLITSSTTDNGNTVGEPQQWTTTTTTVKSSNMGGDSAEPETTTTTVVTSGSGPISKFPSSSTESQKPGSDDEDMVAKWGKPLGVPAVHPDDTALEPSNVEGRATPRKDGKSSVKSGSTPKQSKKPYRTRHAQPIYLDLAYVPHHGNSNYSDSEFFRLIRSRYYVMSGVEPSREVFDGLLRGKQEWEDKNLDVTIIPTYDTDTLGYWVAESEAALGEARIDLAPSASRCTINLQDHETSCSAYRLEF